jgi:cytochrome c peroxidase
MKNLLLALLALHCTAFAQAPSTEKSLDETLKEIILKHDLRPLKKVIPAPMERSRLGAMLFHENSLSGNRDVSCTSCHHPRFGTTEPIPFSIGTGGSGMGSGRHQRNGGVTKRHSPHLLNLGYQEIEFMFWDGRIHRDQKSGVLTTPEPAINGANPVRKDIARTLSTALAAQTIFPIVNQLEMMGENNDIAKAFNKEGNLGAWKAIMKRLTTGNLGKRYLDQFKKAFPQATEFHIGHVGEAFGAFLGRSFNIIDTPYDRYLKGDSTAMSESEKRGLIVFSNRGKCIRCHNGAHLSNWEFKTVGTPQLTPEKYVAPYDQGRFEVTGLKRDLFKFRTPALRNLAITAPYMHNGSLATLEDVIKHYNDPKKSLDSYDLTDVDLSNYTSNFVIDRDEKRNKLRINLISIGEVRRGVNLTKIEQDDLLAFLRTALLDYRFQRERLREEN